MWVKKAPIELIEDGDISDGSKTFTDLALSLYNSEGGVQGISILPRHSNINDEPLTE